MKLHVRSLALILFLLLLTSCYNNSITEKELTAFIESQDLKHVSIQKLSDSVYYIFSEPRIFVYKGSSGYHASNSLEQDKILIGGLEKGSVGLIIRNTNILRNAKTYSVVIDQRNREYEYKGEKFLVIKDYRIWNPTPQMKIIFYNDNSEIIYETAY
ncbi:hypothetical protein GCM10010912_19070 [Paenibacillus albidus]|uniref:Lipoprotein n=1 Tax=Paenibacillus albidus TaxID=2041023 RepID=A0A917FFY1_9BACL|nr:hypothetical protein [Paenibacillus albidus]GGF74027.1 hypothetical protein GCM10010912_19070 [Paenibacillus albidus]